MSKTIVVTGSTRGIGFGLAHEFLRRGCRVMINGRSRAAVDAALKDLSNRHGSDRVGGCPADMTVYDQVQSLWDQSIKRFGRIDIWINNAGVAHPDVEFWKLPVAEIDRPSASICSACCMAAAWRSMACWHRAAAFSTTCTASAARGAFARG